MLQTGDFVKIDYTLTVKETSDLVDTTRLDDAKKFNKYEENKKYEPELVVLGGGWVPKGLEDALLEMDVGIEKVVEIPPDKAFGRRDPANIKTMPLRKFKEVKGLATGARVDVDGKVGTVKSIGAGRVLVDFNPPLSGRTLIYDVKILEKIVGSKEKVIELAKRRMPFAKTESLLVDIVGNAVTIKVPEEAFLAEGIQYVKRALFNDVTKYLKDVSEVTFQEVLKIEQPKKEGGEGQEAAAEGAQTKASADKEPTSEAQAEQTAH